MIDAKGLAREYKIRKHYRGTMAGIRNLLTREYSLVKAVDDISFHIGAGELVGYLGPNGAGKSTTIKMLTGILVPTAGELTVGGLVPWRDRVRHVRRLGVVFGQRTTLWWDLPLVESFELLRHIYRLPEQKYRSNLADFCDLLNLDEFLSTPVRSLSLGQRMRADLAAAFLHDPEIVFLDEPTIGLDVLAKERIREFISAINRLRRTTVILTTHDLGDISRLCRRVMMIDRGKILFDGPLQDMVERFGGERQLVVELAEDYDDLTLPGARVVSVQGRKVTYSFRPNGRGAASLIEDLSRRFRWDDIGLREPDIEATVRKIYEDRERERAV